MKYWMEVPAELVASSNKCGLVSAVTRVSTTVQEPAATQEAALKVVSVPAEYRKAIALEFGVSVANLVVLRMVVLLVPRALPLFQVARPTQYRVLVVEEIA